MCISETFVQTNEVKRPGCNEMVMLARLNLLQLQQFVRSLLYNLRPGTLRASQRDVDLHGFY